MSSRPRRLRPSALVGWDQSALTAVADRVRTAGARTTARLLSDKDVQSVEDSISAVASELGSAATAFQRAPIPECQPAHVDTARARRRLAWGVGGLSVAVQAAIPHLTHPSRVTSTIGSAAESPNPGTASLGVQETGLRGLVHSIDLHLCRDGIRAVSVIEADSLSREEWSACAIAEAVIAAGRQNPGGWQVE
jgi:NAD(P)-dependent dehydrogenase (short-subunit alcohol dehydrogenase family)